MPPAAATATLLSSLIARRLARRFAHRDPDAVAIEEIERRVAAGCRRRSWCAAGSTGRRLREQERGHEEQHDDGFTLVEQPGGTVRAALSCQGGFYAFLASRQSIAVGVRRRVVIPICSLIDPDPLLDFEMSASRPT